jgi:hypothetical protein
MTTRRTLRHARMLAAVAAVALPHASRAQGGLLLQGVYDAELWKTDSASQLLARNSGKLGALGRINLWTAIEPVRDVVLFGQLQAETGKARAEPGSEVYVNQYGARWSPSDAFVLEAGKMTHIVGVFSARHLSFRNPLIGDPDGYTLAYPFGVRVSGTASIFDYRAGLLSKPLWHEGYTPHPSNAARPAIGVGVTPFTGFRMGASATVGPYLNSENAVFIADGDWRRYKQRIVAADLQFSRGYFEANAELAHASFDVPDRADAATGLTWYVETKYTFTPRFYMAVRAERNDYPFIAAAAIPSGGSPWVASNSDFTDVEVGGGFRVTSSTLLKMSVRADHWVPNPNPYAPSASGRALAFQLSQTFDLVELATRQR